MVELDKEAMEQAHSELYAYGLTPITERCAETFLRAYLEAAGMTWRPISEAKKDKKTAILVFIPHQIEMPEENYCWADRFKMNVVQAIWHEPDNRTSEPAGWYAPFTEFYGGVSSDPSCEFNSVKLEPTHFMPLPASPKP